MNKKITKAVAYVTILSLGISSYTLQVNDIENGGLSSSYAVESDGSAENVNDVDTAGEYSDGSNAQIEDESNSNQDGESPQDEKNTESESAEPSDSESENEKDSIDKKDDADKNDSATESDSSKNGESDGEGSDSAQSSDKKAGENKSDASSDSKNAGTTDLNSDKSAETRDNTVSKALDLTNIKYFRSTMYNYLDDTYNKELNKLEIINETVTNQWNGFYFYATEIFNSKLWENSVSLEQVKPQFDADGNITNLIDGKYVLKSVQADKYVAINDGQLVESDDYIEWSIKKTGDETYSIKDTSGKAMSVGDGIGVVSDAAVADTYTDFSITKHKQVVDGVEQDGVDNAVMINTASENEYRLNDIDYDDNTIFAGYAGNDEIGEREPYIVYEAEDAKLEGAVITNATACSNGKRIGNVGGANKGTVTFTVNAEVAGEKILEIYHCTQGTRNLSVTVNGEEINPKLACASSGGWDIPTGTPNKLVIELIKGENTIVLAGAVNDAGEIGDAPNIDKIHIVDIQTEIYEAEEDAVLSGGAGNNNNGLVGNIGNNGGEGAATFTLENMTAGERILRVYYVQSANRQITVTVNDNEAVAFNCNNTGSWENLDTAEYVTMNITLTEGNNTIKIAGNGNFGPNIDKIEIVEPQVLSYEAEDGVLSGDLESGEHIRIIEANDSSNGQYVGYVGGPNKNTITFNVDVATAGTKTIKVYYAQDDNNGNGHRSISVIVNGTEQPELVCGDTGSWSKAGEPATMEIELVAGENTIELTGYEEAYAPNIDWIQIVDWDERIALTEKPARIEIGCAFNIYRVKSELYATKVIPEFDSAGNITNLESGKYVIVNCKHNRAVDISEDVNLTLGEMSGLRLAKNLTPAIDTENYVSNTEDEVVADAMLWTITNNEDGTYSIQDDKGRYMYITFANSQTSGIAYEGKVNPDVMFAIRKYTGTGDTALSTENAVTLGRNSWNGGDGDLYLNATGADEKGYFGGWGQDDPGNAFVLYKISETAKEIDNIYDNGKLSGTDRNDDYALWNYSTLQAYGDREGTFVYDGIVENQLKDGLPVFTMPQAGIFDSNKEVKDIYSDIGIPFAYDDGYYIFDSNEMGAVVSEDGNGELEDGNDLVLLKNPQKRINGGIIETIWAPFDHATTDETMIQGNAGFDYHFGMNMTIPFTMTKNGRVKENADEDDEANNPITFEFSGDDDVWIFIDGQLVLDLGGIHGRVGGTINFAENTWELGYTTTVEGEDGVEEEQKVTVLNYNEKTPVSGKLFNDDEGEGRINQTRESFASTDNHEIQIFYLERGRGSSNCKIKFNLPMKDTVSVTKKADKSITADGVIDSLTTEEQERVDNVFFGFTLYKKVIGETEYTPVTNTNYDLMDADGKYVTTASTDASGLFILQNGLTARFTTELPADGVSYYVEETPVNGFSKSEYTYSGQAEQFTYLNGDAQTPTDLTDIGTGRIDNSQAAVKSQEITVYGNEEEMDSLQFVCENYYDASMENGTAYLQDDIIVIDYGLGVSISPLVNDLYRGDGIKLVSVSGAEYGNATVSGNVINYQLNQTLSDIEILDYVVEITYKNEAEEILTNSYTGKVQIIPATSMYYEEDFGSMVTYDSKVGNWTTIGTAQTAYQEPGVVGTIGDSPYGSDMAYLSDGGDSNGSSKYISTANGAAQFSYEFTGTGTAFFARTNTTSGYMRVVVKKKTPTNLLKDTEWTPYIGSDWTWCDGTLTSENGVVTGDFTTTGGGWADAIWGIQATSHTVQVKAGTEYTYSAMINATKDMTIGVKLTNAADNEGISYETINVKAGEQYKYTKTFTAKQDTVKVIYALGGGEEGAVEDVEFTISENTLVEGAGEIPTEEFTTKTVETRFRDTVYKVDGATLYNIPVYNIEDLEYGTYTVTVAISTPTSAGYGSDFWLDGIRVYNPLGTGDALVANYPMANSAYSTDGEANNTVVTLRDKLLKDVTLEDEEGILSWDEGNGFVLFTDKYGEMQSADDYKSFGPKEEVYLNDGQSVSFSLVNWDPNTNKIYLGMKAPKGKGNVLVNGQSMALNNAADCYYVINPTITEEIIDGQTVKIANFVIQAEDGSLVSLTNIKVTGTAQFAIYEKN